MPLSAGMSFLIIVVVAITTFATRVIPFLVFPKGKEIPKTVQYLGKVLTPAVIGMLVVYCLKGTTILSKPYGIPEAVSVLVVAVLHIWKRNNLLSIGVGTVLYMFLVIEGKDMIKFVVFRSNIVKQFSYSFFLCHIYFCFLLIKYTYVSRITFISKA